MELIVYKNDSVHFSHLPFTDKWSMDMAILFDNKSLIHSVLPFDKEVENDDKFVCKIHLTNTVVGDFNQLIVSGLALENPRFLKGTIKPIFHVLSNVYLFDIEYDDRSL